MPATNDSPSVDFNFDTWERGESVQPFGVVVGGKRYEAIDPLELDYREFEKAEDNAEATFRVLFPKDHEKILDPKNKIRMGALAEFNRRVLEHYGLGNTPAS